MFKVTENQGMTLHYLAKYPLARVTDRNFWASPASATQAFRAIRAMQKKDWVNQAGDLTEDGYDALQVWYAGRGW